MTTSFVLGRWLAILIALAMVVALVACSGDSEPEPPETPEPEPAADVAADEPEPETAADDPEPVASETTDEPATAEEPEAEAATTETDDEPAETAETDDEPAAQEEPSSGELDLSIDGGTTWQEVFDALTDAEQSCVRDAVGGDLLASALSERILVEGDTEPWQADLLSCLSEPAARACSSPSRSRRPRRAA